MDATSSAGDGTAARQRRVWFGLLLGAALLAAGAGAWLLGKPAEQTEAQVLGANLPVNAGALDRRDISANNSPALARNPADPANLVVANRIDLPRYSCALHVSFNGGASWEDVAVPFPAGEEEPARCYAPDVAYAPDGTLHLSYVTLKGIGNVPNAVWTVSSSDGGRTLTVPVRAAGPLAFQVQLTADPDQGNRLYLNWLQAEATGSLLFPNTGNPIVSSTSIDGGATWSAPKRVSPTSRARVVAPAPALGPNGELYVLYLDLLEDRLDYAGAHEGRGGDPYEGPWALVLARSIDQGSTWEEALIDGEIRPTQRFVVFLPPTPTLAVDTDDGRVYAGFTDGRNGDPDVHVWTSADGGKTFGTPVRANDTPVKDGTSQYMPRLDVAPGGRLDVVYLDRRADTTNVYNEVSLQSSFDKGRTFTGRVRVSDRAFDSRVGPGSERNLPDLGSRLALVSTSRRALAVWPDTRGGNDLTNKQDLASAVIDVPEPAASSRSWLRPVGLVAVALGLLCLVFALRSRRGAVQLDPSVARPGRAPKVRRPRPAPEAPPTPATVPAHAGAQDSGPPAADAPDPADLPRPAPAGPPPPPASSTPVAPPPPVGQPAPVPGPLAPPPAPSPPGWLTPPPSSDPGSSSPPAAPDGPPHDPSPSVLDGPEVPAPLPTGVEPGPVAAEPGEGAAHPLPSTSSPSIEGSEPEPVAPPEDGAREGDPPGGRSL